MRTSTPDRLTAATAEQLLDGGEEPADLRRLLAAAAGPGTARELAGEAAALAAFADAPGASSLPSAPSRRPSMLSTALLRTVAAKIVTAKAVIAVVLLAGATGGVALAATVSGGSGAPPADRPAATRTAAPPSATEDGADNGADNGPDRTESGPPAEPAPAATGGPAAPAPSLAGLCTAWAAGAGSNPGSAAGNPAFSALVDAAGSPEEVDGYCADPNTGPNTGPDADPDTAPNGPGNDGAEPGAGRDRLTGPPAGTGDRGGSPTAAPGFPERPAGPPAAAPRPDTDATSGEEVQPGPPGDGNGGNGGKADD